MDSTCCNKNKLVCYCNLCQKYVTFSIPEKKKKQQTDKLEKTVVDADDEVVCCDVSIVVDTVEAIVVDADVELKWGLDGFSCEVDVWPMLEEELSVVERFWVPGEVSGT